ncbi:unnamed protein product [Fusarium graminearum]|nr:unnamed protein product [Fusarium graminearum]
MEIYYRSLKEEVKDELHKADRPNNLTEYITIAIKIDERQYERRREKTNAIRKGIRTNGPRSYLNNRTTKGPQQVQVLQLQPNGTHGTIMPTTKKTKKP